MERDSKGRFIKGMKLTEEVKAKMKGRIPWNKGKKMSDLIKDYSNPFLGKQHSFESLEKNRIKHIGLKANANQLAALKKGRKKGKLAPWARKNPQIFKSGKLHPNWQGGKSYRGFGWTKLSKEIKQRDNQECKSCLSKTKLSVHHIIPYRFTKDNAGHNLITLCSSCHAKADYHFRIRYKNMVEVSRYALDKIQEDSVTFNLGTGFNGIVYREVVE